MIKQITQELKKKKEMTEENEKKPDEKNLRTKFI